MQRVLVQISFINLINFINLIDKYFTILHVRDVCIERAYAAPLLSIESAAFATTKFLGALDSQHCFHPHWQPVCSLLPGNVILTLSGGAILRRPVISPGFACLRPSPCTTANPENGKAFCGQVVIPLIIHSTLLR